MKRRHLIAVAPAWWLARLHAAEPVMLFAAASLGEVLPAMLAAVPGLPACRFSFAASSTLARQVEHGAPADVFISADEAWMDHLHRAGKLQPASRRVLAGNRLVVVRATAGGADAQASTAQDTDSLKRALAGARVATGDPAHVPVGRYAEAALRHLGLWVDVAPRLVRADNVRSALAFVERGEAPAGIVYATDAAVAPRVRVAARFPRGSHPPVQYPAALLAGARPEARAVFEALFSAPAQAVLRRAGFEAVGG